MPAATIVELEHQLGSLGLNTPLPQFKDTSVLSNPIDIYRSHLAVWLTGVLSPDSGSIFDAIHASSDLSLSDLAVILPKLKLGEEETKLSLSNHVSPLALFGHKCARQCES
jgi:hypothetical protein